MYVAGATLQVSGAVWEASKGKLVFDISKGYTALSLNTLNLISHPHIYMFLVSYQ